MPLRHSLHHHADGSDVCIGRRPSRAGTMSSSRNDVLVHQRCPWRCRRARAHGLERFAQHARIDSASIRSHRTARQPSRQSGSGHRRPRRPRHKSHSVSKMYSYTYRTKYRRAETRGEAVLASYTSPRIEVRPKRYILIFEPPTNPAAMSHVWVDTCVLCRISFGVPKRVSYR